MTPLIHAKTNISRLDPEKCENSVLLPSKSVHEKHEMEDKIIFRDECYAIQGAVFAVYREIGCGFLEAVYQECLEKELRLRGIPFVSQQELKLYYKGEELKQFYKPDLICFDKVIVELKALRELTGEHRAQVLNYLKSTGMKVGLLANFGSHPKAIVEWIIL